MTSRSAALTDKVKNWYVRYERPFSSISLVGGFIFDAIALKRIDLFLENFWIIIHLVMVGLCVIFINLYEKREGGKVLEEAVPGRMHFWLILTLQFTFGGLFSTFIVFYFRSATLATSWLFMVLLGMIFIGNEGLKKHYTRLSLQVSFFFISIYLFAIFFVPVILHQISPLAFIVAGVGSLIVIALFLECQQAITKEKVWRNKTLLVCLASITILFNVLYFTNLIPPIPLSLKDAKVSHVVGRTNTGDYELKSEVVDIVSGWRDYIRSYSVYHQLPGEPVYVYSAVFSPTALNTSIIHNWQHYNEGSKKWISVSKVNLFVNGGRDGGYRTYSYKTAIEPGLWRVDVETPRGQDIGRIKFRIEPATVTPVLETTVH